MKRASSVPWPDVGRANRSSPNPVAWFLHRKACKSLRQEDDVSVTGNDADLGEKGKRGSATTQRVAERAHQTIDRAAEVAAEAEESVRTSAQRATERLREGEERARESFDDSVNRLRTYVEQNPLAAAGIAFAAGLLVSALLRR